MVNMSILVGFFHLFHHHYHDGNPLFLLVIMVITYDFEALLLDYYLSSRVVSHGS